MTESRPARITRGPARFTAADIKRAVRGAQKANIAIAAVKILPDGSILVIPGTPEPVPTSGPNPWDDD